MHDTVSIPNCFSSFGDCPEKKACFDLGLIAKDELPLTPYLIRKSVT